MRRAAAPARPAPARPAPARPPDPAAAPAAAPAPAPQALASAPSADAAAAWRGALAAWLQAHKTYPDAARRAGIEGRAVVRFTMDRTGAVTAVALLQDSGSAELDDAAVALLRGARLPPPPATDTITLTLPIRYSLAP